MMEPNVIVLLSVCGILALLLAGIGWAGRRDFRIYRAWYGGQWGCVRDKTHWGMHPILRWEPMAEIQEGEHIVEWETWPARTRVRREKRR
jgi:hypothetical protein